MYLIVLCFVLHQIVGLLAIHFVGLKTQCYAQHQMHIHNICKQLRRSFCENVNGLRKLLHWPKLTLMALTQ